MPRDALRIGDDLELDRAAYELRRSGRPLKLERIPMEILLLLIDRRGQLVSREEIIEKIWGKDVYLGTDNSINSAIRKIRQVLKDDPEKPTFIQTVTAKGYRFIATVTQIEDPAPEPSPPVISPEPETPLLETPSADPSPGAPPPPHPPLSRWVVVPVVALLVFLGVGIYLSRLMARTRTAASASHRVMFAVLPFVNLSGDSTQDYFVDGLTEETITDLGQLSPESLGVIARTSAMAYKHTDKTVSQIGHELGVDYILEGSVRREGGKVRVSAKLIRVSDQTYLWAQSYDRELADLLDVENYLGRSIAEQVSANLTLQQKVKLSKKRSVNPEAYDLYLRGRFYWNQRTPNALMESIRYFQKAIAEDPDFALAYAGLADAYNFSNILGVHTPRQSFPQAREAAIKAIQLDPPLAEAHAALGMEKSHYEFDFPGAEQEFLKALEVNPNSPYAHLFYSNCFLMPMGRKAQAIAENKRAVEIDPLSLPINNFLGMTYMLAGDYESAQRQFLHTIALNPGFPLSHEYYSQLLIAMGKYEDSIKEYDKSMVLNGGTPEEGAADGIVMVKAFKTGGAKGFWKKILEYDLIASKKPGARFSPSALAGAYAGAGQIDEAFASLEKAYEEREGQNLTLMNFIPDYKNLHGDPRFSAMLRKIGLPE